MKSLLLRIVCVSIALTVLSGCEEGLKVSGRNTAPEALFNITQHERLESEAVCKYYNNSSPYFTKQIHNIIPSINAISVTSNEPQGQFEWQLMNSQYLVSSGKDKIQSLDITLCDKELCTLIRDSILSHGTLISVEGMEKYPKSVKIQGIWYDIYHRTIFDKIKISEPKENSKEEKTPEESYTKKPWANEKFYARKDTKLVDRVSISVIGRDTTLSSFSYNPRWVAQIKNSVPTRINILNGSPEDLDCDLLIDISYSFISYKK